MLRLGGRLSLRLERRAIALAALLLSGMLALSLLSLASGKYPVAPGEVAAILAGGGEGRARMVVIEWRLPRVLLALLLGGALGLGGAIFQSLTRNPLGSPDVIGFSAGAQTGALAVLLLMGGGYYRTAAGALAGGLSAAAAVGLLARRGGAQGFRLIVVGIGVSAMLSALNAWMMRAAELQAAMGAAAWGAGSLNGLGFGELVPVAVVLGLLLPPVLLLAPALRQMEMGDDIAIACGVAVAPVRLALMVLGVALTATATAAAGPIAFVALAAPQIARRLARTARPVPLLAALTGALLLASADWAAQHALPTQVPVGLMTLSIGGAYFIRILMKEGRK